MKVKEIATAAGVNPDTVRFYTREGLLRPVRNPDNNYQLYDAEDLRRLRFARKARQQGVSVPVIPQPNPAADPSGQTATAAHPRQYTAVDVLSTPSNSIR